MKFTEKLLFGVGTIVIIFGFVMIAGGLGMVFEPKQNRAVMENLVFLLFLGIVPTVAGFLLCWRMHRSGKRRAGERRERHILKLAKHNNGCLTIAEVSLRMSLTSIEAKKALDACHLNHLAEMEVSEDGVVVYRFKGLA